MALTNLEVVQAAPSIIDTDGVFTQFDRAALIDFARRITHVELARYENIVHIAVAENGVAKNVEGFASLTIAPSLCVLEVLDDSGTLHTKTLADTVNLQVGAYVFDAAPATLPPALAVRLTLQIAFTNPATANNPAAVEQFGLTFFEGLNAQDPNISAALGKRVLALSDNGWVHEVDI